MQMAWAEFSARRGDVDQALEQASAAMALASRSGAMANVRRSVLDGAMPCHMSCCVPCASEQPLQGTSEGHLCEGDANISGHSIC